jgi:Protein of unknown function (DUF1446).
MRTVKIASGAGFGGDRIEPALDIIKQDAADYIMFECLAERTIALAQKKKLDNPELGYNPLLDYRMKKVIPLLKKHPIKIITNMGAANPVAAAKRIYELACESDMEDLKVAVIIGDNVIESIKRFYDHEIMENGEKLESLDGKIISANAYIGGRSISRALAKGADIVVTGREADPLLCSGPLMYEFGKSYEDYEFLGKTVVAGHLLECGGQVTGGDFADPGKKDVPDLWNLGFPIVEFEESGDFTISKLPDTGGMVTEATVKEQLLYEIQDPANYITPDVIADFSNLKTEQIKKDTVKVTGGSGKAATKTYKVSVGYEDGYIGTGEISYGGRNCLARGNLCIRIIEEHMKELADRVLEQRLDMIGVNSLFGNTSAIPTEPAEVRIRLAIRTENREDAKEAGREIESLYTNGPAGGGGARSGVSHIIAIASILMDKTCIQEDILWEGKKDEVI